MKTGRIIFTPENAAAVLAGRKTQSRRVVSTPVWGICGCCGQSTGVCDRGPITYHTAATCRYGVVGDQIRVKEAHWLWTGCGAPPAEFVVGPTGRSPASTSSRSTRTARPDTRSLSRP